MYCPKCGGIITGDDTLYGGTAAYRCSNCNFCIYNHDPFTESGIEIIVELLKK